jgi:hypothetical protein
VNEEIIPADRTYRRTLLVIYLVLVLVGGALIGWVLPWAEGYLEGLEATRALGVIKFALIVLFLSMVPLGAYLFSVGRKMMKYQRFPPLGMKVITDTQVVEGEKVKFQGQVVVVLSLILILLGLFGAIYCSYLIDQITSGVPT